MFGIRPIWQRTAQARNTERVTLTVTTLEEAASLYRQAAEVLEVAAKDLRENVKPVVAREGFDRGATANVAQFTGSKVAEAARRVWQAQEVATEAVVYASGLESVLTDEGN